MTIKDCPTCGGTHYGVIKCPYILAPCVICGAPTIYACSDCAIDAAGRASVHVCSQSGCMDAHEAQAHAPAGSPDDPEVDVIGVDRRVEP